jgi:c(7)-type cytochrome triheme protein
VKASKITATIIVFLTGLFFVGNTVLAQQPADEGMIIYTKPVKSVIFNHKAHSEDYGISCNICHDKLFQMEASNVEKKADFNHKGFNKGKYCGACHDGKKGFAMDKQCTKCHIGVKGYDKFQKQLKK